MHRRRGDSMKFLHRIHRAHIGHIYICNSPMYIRSIHAHAHGCINIRWAVTKRARGPDHCWKLLVQRASVAPSINVSSRFSWLITWKTGERPGHKIPESSTKLIKRPFRRPAPFHFTLMVIRCLSNRWGWNCPVISPPPPRWCAIIYPRGGGRNDIFRLFLGNFSRVSCLFIMCISDALLHFYITFYSMVFFIDYL